MKRPLILSGLISTLLVVAGTSARAQFAPGPNPITGTTGAQTLSSGTGTVNSGGKITIGSSTASVTASGTITLNNNGTIEQTSSGRAIDNNTAGAVLTVNNTGMITTGSSDAFRINKDSSVLLTNSGTISVSAGNGGQALDWAAITTKSNEVRNQLGGVISDVGEDAVRPGVNGVIVNAGSILATPTGTTAPSGSDGVQADLTGVQITNTGSISGRHGITGGATASAPTYNIIIMNNAGTLSGQNGSGINIDGVFTTATANVTNAFGATIKGGALAAATDSDGDGVDVDGVLTLNNSGDILGLGAKGVGSDGLNNNPEAVAAGGGTIINNATGRIIGSSLAADAPNGDPTRAGSGILVDNSSNGNAIAVTNITNSGLIQGKSGAGITIVGTFADSVTNNAGGIIRGAGATAAIQTGGGDDQVTNRGSIIGDGGKAIDLQDGNDTLTVEGGVASIVGDVSGGTGTNSFLINPGAGQAFTYAGSLSNFGTVHIQSGSVVLSGVSTYTGVTKVTGRLELQGNNRISSSSALNLGGYLKVTASGANGQSFASLTLADNSIIDLDHSTSLTFGGLTSFTLGKTLDIVNYTSSISPDYAIRFAGDLTANAQFLSFVQATSVNGGTAAIQYDGTYTDVFAAVPEPATLAFGLALVGLIGCSRFGRSRALDV